MFHPIRQLRPYLLATVLIGVLTGCAVRVYDPDHRDYHYWNRGEVVYYNQWVAENHRPNVEFRTLGPEDQRAYWNWRHSH